MALTKLWLGLVGAAALLVGAAGATAAERDKEVAVKVANLSTPVLCAEEDNVTLTFAAPKVRSFRVEAVHPAYLASLKEDNWDADWTSCTFGPVAKAETKTATKTPAAAPKLPERVTLYESVDRWLVGLRFPNFWRDATATVRVGKTVTEGLHLIQLWRVRPNGGEEVLVMYPQDGYWRARPKGPKGRDLTAFGSSFLIGPVEQIGRPIVRLKQITYDPAMEGFDLAFASGGSAVVKLAEASVTRLALDVTLENVNFNQPFAALRSMYVTGYNNDIAVVISLMPRGVLLAKPLENHVWGTGVVA